MQIKESLLPEVLLIEPDVYKDNRGFFFESFHAKRYSEKGIPSNFVQDNHSQSSRNTLRGLHAQKKFPQGKLVRVLKGEIFDVAVDVRRGSPRFGKWVGFHLNDQNFKQMYIPPGFVHGFCVLSETAEVEYKCTEFYHPEDEFGVLWNDPAIGIQWPLRDPLLSKKDSQLKRLSESEDQLPLFPQTSQVS